MDNNNNITTAEVSEIKSAYGALAAKVKKDAGKLPRVEWFRVDVDKGTGSAKTWHATGYVLQLKVVGLDGTYLAGTVGAAYGMNVKSRYATAEEAREAGFAVKKTWGRTVKKAASKAKGATLAEKVASMSEAEKQALMAALMAK